jgi:2-hydroxychromene-2-carboxylate isomerase
VAAIDFHWDLGSTNTYFALHLLKPIAARHGAEIVPRPFNLGYVFRANGYVLAEEPRAKLRHRGVDLRRWAKRHGLPFRMPDVFPIKTSRALRGALAMRELGQEWPFIEAIFRAYWELNDASVADYAGLRRVAAALGVDPDAFEILAESGPIRAKLEAETNAALERGVFGAPTMFVGDEMFWGKDRMDFLEAELERGLATAAGGGPEA